MEEQGVLLVHNSNAFGCDLLKLLCQMNKNANVFISPMSIATALTMAACGATEGGEAFEAMRKVLRQNQLGEEEITQQYGKLLAIFGRTEDAVELHIANSAWYKQGTGDIQEAFKARTAKSFGAEVCPLTSAEEINHWVSEKTHNRIPELLQQLPERVALILVNAVYFAGKWGIPFDKKHTHEEPFTLSDGTTRTIHMMFQKRKDFPYCDMNGRFQMVQLDYGKEGAYCASVILPYPDVGCDDLIAELDADALESWRTSLKESEGSLYLPRMKVSYGACSLKDPLASLGMGPAFRASDAFQRIGSNIYLSDVLHKTELELDEEGTTAAAATAVVTARAMVMQKQFVMKVDRPFLFMISEKSTGSLLFLGKIVQPQY